MTAIARTDVDVSSAQVITNKDLSSNTNTFPAFSAHLTPVCTTAGGATGTEDGANTWAKLVTFTTGTNQTVEGSYIYAINEIGAGGNLKEAALIAVGVGSNATSANPTAAVTMLAHTGGYWLTSDAFKVISDGWTSDIVLWMKKAQTYGRFTVCEVGKAAHASLVVTYNDGAAWQSTTPTGAVNNVSTSGVSSGVTFTAPSLIVSSSRTPASSSATGTTGTVCWDASYIYVCTATNTWKRAALSTW